MAIIAHNGILTGTNVELNVGNFTAAYVYVKYTKGTETSVDLSFKMRDAHHPNQAESFYITKVDATGILAREVFTMNATDMYLIPVPVPESADFLTLEFTFNGAASGTIETFFNISVLRA
ncbi:MAG: hypothetical protein R8M45_03640 [Ghiorsea sp.]